MPVTTIDDDVQFTLLRQDHDGGDEHDSDATLDIAIYNYTFDQIINGRDTHKTRKVGFVSVRYPLFHDPVLTSRSWRR